MTLQFSGVDNLLATFRSQSLKHAREVEATITYEAPYAVFVHENLEMKWAGKLRKGKNKQGVYWGRPWSPGSSKYLEKATRRLKAQTAKTIHRMLTARRSLHDAVLAAARDILSLSNSMVPIDEGDLLLSGKIRIKETR